MTMNPYLLSDSSNSFSACELNTTMLHPKDHKVAQADTNAYCVKLVVVGAQKLKTLRFLELTVQIYISYLCVELVVAQVQRCVDRLERFEVDVNLHITCQQYI